MSCLSRNTNSVTSWTRVGRRLGLAGPPARRRIGLRLDRYLVRVSSARVRYLRCVGGDVDKSPGASQVVVRQVHEDGMWRFEGYVLFNDRGEVIEKSVRYGQYEEEDDWIERQSECTQISRGEFAAAWRSPYAERTMKQRFFSHLNGCRDHFDPSVSDPT